MKSPNIIYTFYGNVGNFEATVIVLICIFNITIKLTVRLQILASGVALEIV